MLREAKRHGVSDAHLAEVWGCTAEAVRARRLALGVRPVFKRVDTCAAEFESFTPYLYSTYEDEDEAEPTDRRKIMILGSGPNRIGQGIEFDYCCVHAAYALKEEGFETIMVNCNPETVSTDYDTSDRLYFEPLTFEDVMAIVDEEKPEGVIVQFGGQTPLNLARQLKAAGVPIIGTSPESIDLAEDRKHFGKLLADLKIPPASKWRRHERPGGRGDRARNRISRAVASLLRAGRTRHGDCVRRGHAARLRPPRGRTAARLPHPGGPLPGKRYGGGCGRVGGRG